VAQGRVTPGRGQTRLFKLGPRLILPLLLGALVSAPASAADADARLAVIASEARQTIEVINWFYLRHRACPQPARPAELETMQRELGDGFSVDRQGQFVAIRGISMSSVWLYYTSPAHPEKCTLWRKLGWDPALIWRRHNGGRWTFDPGDGSAERPLKFGSMPTRVGDK
jgi:hypothetical protein